VRTGGRVQEVHRFNRFEVHAQQRQLLVDGKPVVVGARAFDLLLALIAQRGQLVSKNELFDAVWPGRVVEDNNLVVQVGALRKLLGPDVIATVPGRGYHLTALAQDSGAIPVPTAGPTPAAPDAVEVALPLIGREDDLLALSAVLSTHRLVTITGPGGMGKTRVARQLAHDRRSAFEHGMSWVDLTGLADPVLVASTIAHALGLQLGSGDPQAGLLSWLRSRRQLVVIDNAEHLIDAVARLVRVALDTAPGVHLLVTSQAPLREAGERIYRLGALEVPDGDVTPAEALSHGAVALFVERAQDSDRSFMLSQANCAGVVAICRQLDGLPLAIELAAARVPMLGIQGLASGLDERLRWLTGGRRSAPARQQTLRAALEWTCDLLGDAERKVLRRLAVFAGGFTLDMARAVVADDAATSGAGTPALDVWEVTEALAVLVERSLVVADTAAMPRYALLESPRAYAAELLERAGETLWARRRHAKHFTARYDAACDDWLCMSDADWVAAYPVETENIRVAIQWAMGPGGDVEAGLLLIASTSNMWTNVGLYAESLARHQMALSRLRHDTPVQLRARLLVGLGQLRLNGAPAEAKADLGAASVAYRECGESLGLTNSLIGVARAAAYMGQVDDAARALEAAQTLDWSDFGDRMRGRLADVHGFVLAQRGDHQGALSSYGCALALYRSSGSKSMELNMLLKFASEAWSVGDLDAAVQGFADAAETLRSSPWTTKGMLGVCLTNLAGVHIERMELDAALKAARAGLPLREEAGYAWGALDHLALRAALAGRHDDAARLAGCADAVFATKAAARQPNEARARARLQALLLERTSAEQLRALLGEGALMDIAQACRMALSS
jgi:predicted ATPase/DNA-binding winged helix-turn-helix (wHTH) protein